MRAVPSVGLGFSPTIITTVDLQNRSHVAAGACPLSTGWRHEPSDKRHRATRSERAIGMKSGVCAGTCCYAPLAHLPTLCE